MGFKNPKYIWVYKPEIVEIRIGGEKPGPGIPGRKDRNAQPMPPSSKQRGRHTIRYYTITDANSRPGWGGDGGGVVKRARSLPGDPTPVEIQVLEIGAPGELAHPRIPGDFFPSKIFSKIASVYFSPVSYLKLLSKMRFALI